MDKRQKAPCLTAGVSVDGGGRGGLQLWLGGVAGGVGAGVQGGQGLQHAQQAVGGGQLEVLLRDVAHLPAAVSGLVAEQRAERRGGLSRDG